MTMEGVVMSNPPLFPIPSSPIPYPLPPPVRWCFAFAVRRVAEGSPSNDPHVRVSWMRLDPVHSSDQGYAVR